MCALVFNFNQYQTGWEAATDDYIEFMERYGMPLGLKQRAFRYLWFVHHSARVEDKTAYAKLPLTTTLPLHCYHITTTLLLHYFYIAMK